MDDMFRAASEASTAIETLPYVPETEAYDAGVYECYQQHLLDAQHFANERNARSQCTTGRNSLVPQLERFLA